MSDYIPYDQITKNKGKSDATAEMEIGEYYFKKGYYAMIAKQGYVRHIGEETRSKDVAISGIWSHDEAKVEHKHSPKLARELLKLLPKSSPVIDLGCGLGYYLNELQKSGFECYGFEGTPDINLISIFKGIQKADLTKPLKTKVKGSVICLEVGEHIHKSQMEALLDNIDKVCKGILVLSWAIPGQGGNGHLNEMSNVKVRQMMEDRGYKEDRVQTKRLRNIAGSDLWWFKNTMFVFRKN
jgi:SAM-dependent methyltransferase